MKAIEILKLLADSCRAVAGVFDDYASRMTAEENPHRFIRTDDEDVDADYEDTLAEMNVDDPDGEKAAAAAIEMNAEYEKEQREAVDEKPAEKKAKKTRKTAKAEKPETPSVTLDDVRKVLSQKARAGLKDDVKKIITAHGAEKVSELAESEWQAVMDEANALGKEDD